MKTRYRVEITRIVVLATEVEADDEQGAAAQARAEVAGVRLDSDTYDVEVSAWTTVEEVVVIPVRRDVP